MNIQRAETVRDFIMRHYAGSNVEEPFPFQKRCLDAEAAIDLAAEQNARWIAFIELAALRIRDMRHGQVMEQALDQLGRTLIDETPVRAIAKHEWCVSQVPILDDVNELALADKDGVDPFPYISAMLVWLDFENVIERLPSGSKGLFTAPQIQANVALMFAPRPRQLEEAVYKSEQARMEFYESAREYEVKMRDLDAAINRVREESIFKSASALWQGKARRHAAAYAAGFVIILCSLAAIGYTIGSHAQALLTAMPVNKTTGEFTYLAVVIVGLLFVAVAWVYRMLGRFVLENFTLASDARQRQMILQTFLTLVGTPEAEMKEGERVLILSAIFRPAPGQGADDPAPSSLMDLMKGALPASISTEKKG
jgi:hypothetical protein